MRSITVSTDYKSRAGAELTAHETETERLKRQERELRGRIKAFDASDRLSREDLHDRTG
jgi:hypothetical protein